MQFPSRDLTNQYISLSYQDVVQRYASTGSYTYLLDGLGYVIGAITNSAVGGTLLTTDQTASWAVSASWAPGGGASVSASYAEFATSASWAPGSTPTITASYANFATSASAAVSTSHANMASLASVADVAFIADTASIAAQADTASYIEGYDVNGYVSESLYALQSVTADTASFAWEADTASFLEGNAVISQSILFNTASVTVLRKEGQMYWDNDAHTLAIIPDRTGSTLQVGQEMWIRAIGHEFIPNGTAVYVIDAVSGVPCVGLALADGTGTKDKVIGVATEDIPSGSVGLVTSAGQIHDLNTSLWTEGTLLYLSTTTSGSLQSSPPLDPHETVSVGYVLVQDPLVGIIEINVSNIGAKNYPYVGMTTPPSMSVVYTSSTGSVILVSSGSANFCQTTDGTGLVKNYPIPSASFTITSSFIDAQYIIASYNSGSPIYWLSTTRNAIDVTQNTLVFTVLNGANNLLVNSSWDEPGLLLANKDYLRVQALRGVERESGCDLSTSQSVNSANFLITAGYAWQGVNRMALSAVNSTGSRTVLVAHSASVWSGSLITEVVYNKYDNGSNLANVPAGDFVVNWVYRTDVNTDATLVLLGLSYGTLNNAIASQPPTLPENMRDYAFLTGRVIAHNTVNPLTRISQVDSAYVQTFVPAGITDHNLLNNLQGGDGTNYYHLNSASYAQVVDGNIRLVSTTNSTEGIIWKSGSRFIHDYHNTTGSGAVPNGNNLFVGINAGNFTMGATATSAVHASENTALGNSTLLSCSIGYNNTAVGTNALRNDTVGFFNTAVGNRSMALNTSGSRNVAIGPYSSYQNLSGSFNVSVGYFALSSNVSGSQNIAIGSQAGRYLSDGVTNNQSPSCSIYIGTDTKTGADNSNHEIVIGSHAIGLGSNTITLGTSSVVKTALWGNVGIQTTDPQATLHVQGNISASTVTASYFTGTASYADNIPLNGTDGYVPTWNSNTLTSTSSIQTFGEGGRYITINSASYYDPSQTPALHVQQLTNDDVNAGYFEGDADNYIQIVMHNRNTGSAASSDLIGEPDDGQVVSHYIDLGINSTGYNDPAYSIASGSDGYLYVESGSLAIGTSIPGYVTRFHAGGTTSDKEIGRITEQGAIFTGSITTASYVATASSAKTASYLKPGATLYVVSGSDGYEDAYLEPYDYSPETEIYQPPYRAGRVFWDNRYNDWAFYARTQSVGDAPFRFHLGKEVTVGVHNPYSTTLSRLSAVYISGSSVAGQFQPDVYLAQADGTYTKNDVAGIIRNDIPSGSNGFMLIKGVMHRTNMSTFTVGDKLWLSAVTPGGMTITQPEDPYEKIFLGYCTEGGPSGSFLCDIGAIPQTPLVYAGVTQLPVITNNNDGTVSVSTSSVNLFPTADGTGTVQAYPIAQATLSLATGSNITNYIYVDYNFGSPVYQVAQSNPINSLDTVGIAIVNARESSSIWDVDFFQGTTTGLALANKILNRDIRVEGFVRESGFTISETGSLGVAVTAGLTWRGVTRTSSPPVDSISGGSEFYWFYRSGSEWVFEETSSGVVTNKYYSNASGLSELSNSYYNASFVYRLIGTSDEFVYVLSDDQYADLPTAKANSQPPADLPSYITSIGFLVGRVIAQSGSANFASVDSAFTTTFIPSNVTDHNALTNLQGGQGGEYYHLTAVEYNGTGTGSKFVRSNAPTMSAVRFEGATPSHIPYWTDNQTLTLTGSIQVYQNEHVLINSASFPDPSNPETLLIRQIHTGSVNSVGVYSDTDNFSQIYNQNLSNGPSASTDIVATADTGSQYTHYIDMGIAGSKYTGSTWPWTKALDGYLLMDGGDMWLAIDTDHKLLFAFNNVAATSYADKTGFYLSGSLFGTSSWATVASQANSASWAPFAVASVSASWASSSISSSYLYIDGVNYFTPDLTTAGNLQAAYNFYVGGNLHINDQGHVFTSGSMTASYYVGDLLGTASIANTASFIPLGTYVITSSWANSASWAQSASWAPSAVAGTTLYTASTYQITSSWSENAVSASWAPSAVAGTTLYTASTYQITASQAVSASWAPFTDTGTTLITASTYQITSSWSVSSSWSPNQGATTLVTASTYQITASQAVSASWSPNQGATTLVTASTYPITSSWANRATTASYAVGVPTIKSGIVAGGSFAGNPKIYTVTFTNPFPDNNYSVTVTGESSRTWTIQSKVSGSFIINSNNNTAFANNVFWQAIAVGEFYS